MDCSEACLLEGRCVCSKCRFRHLQTDWFCLTSSFSCCSNCTATCTNCPLREKLDPSQLVNAILGLGGEKFK